MLEQWKAWNIFFSVRKIVGWKMIHDPQAWVQAFEIYQGKKIGYSINVRIYVFNIKKQYERKN